MFFRSGNGSRCSNFLLLLDFHLSYFHISSLLDGNGNGGGGVSSDGGLLILTQSSCCLRCRCPHKSTECVDCLLPILFWLICIYSIFLPCQCERCQTVLLPNRSVY
ncbi:hypothetical protein BLOT_011442 [Blomia tropicalis]|nr:hypothetical protein BLOT_011442 [Blomia tropicalis]